MNKRKLARGSIFFHNLLLKRYNLKMELVHIGCVITQPMGYDYVDESSLKITLIPIWGINAAAMTTLLSEMIMLVAGIFMSKRFFRFSNFPIFTTCLLGGTEVFLSCFVASCLTENSLLHIVLSLLFSAVLYVPTLFFTQKKLILAIFH